MSCKNCDCDVEPTAAYDPNADLKQRLSTLERRLEETVSIITAINANYNSINSFLIEKYPVDLMGFDGLAIPVHHWAYLKEQQRQDEKRVNDLIFELRNRGYKVEYIE